MVECRVPPHIRIAISSTLCALGLAACDANFVTVGAVAGGSEMAGAGAGGDAAAGGYAGGGATGGSGGASDPCVDGTHDCVAQAQCVVLADGYECNCAPELHGDGTNSGTGCCGRAEGFCEGACRPLSTRSDCGACGQKCALDQDCYAGACVACRPTHATTTTMPPSVPTDLKTPSITPTPIVRCGGLTYWFFDQLDNALIYQVTAFDDDSGDIARPPFPKSGGRYIQQLSVDVASESVTIFGGDNLEPVVMAWSEFHFP